MAIGTGTALIAGGLAAGSALSAREQKKAAERGAKAQEGAAAGAAQVQREALESFERRTDPFREAGAEGISPLLAQLGITGPAPDPMQSPLIRSLQEDVTRRIFANQAARGKLASGD